MTPRSSDAFVFFGATGDLAYKQIFPALQALIRRGDLHMPIVGVARAGWSLDKLRERARSSLQEHGGVDERAFARLCAQLKYVGGDYRDAATYERLGQALDGAARIAGGAADAADASRELSGASTWAKQLIAMSRGLRFVQPALINGSVGLILAPGGKLSRVLTFTFSNARITRLDVIGDPVRLGEFDIGLLSQPG